MRDLPFIHRFHHPEEEDGSTLILLHGTGGNESDLMPLAHRIAPKAALLGVRGRSTEEGINRWFRRYDAVTYDQEDIRAEAEAFAAFIEGAVKSYGLDPAKMVYMGYSNGANLLAALAILHPGLVRKAVLLRPVMALQEAPAPDLRGLEVLMLSGKSDPFGRMAPALDQALRAAGAEVTTHVVDAAHDVTTGDLALAKEWLAGR